MLIFDLNAKLDIHLVRNKVGIGSAAQTLPRSTPCSQIQSMTLHSSRIHVAILTSG